MPKTRPPYAAEFRRRWSSWSGRGTPNARQTTTGPGQAPGTGARARVGANGSSRIGTRGRRWRPRRGRERYRCGNARARARVGANHRSDAFSSPFDRHRAFSSPALCLRQEAPGGAWRPSASRDSQTAADSRQHRSWPPSDGRPSSVVRVRPVPACSATGRTRSWACSATDQEPSFRLRSSNRLCRSLNRSLKKVLKSSSLRLKFSPI